MSPSCSFSYRPLLNEDDFRLLVIKAGSATESVHCTLHNFSRANSPKYAALSYTWGAPGVTYSILLNGSEFSVRINCESAIRHLRRPDKDVTIWIDAICINQLNTLEKDCQVQHMRENYIHAEKVVIWLGDEDEYTHEAVALLRQVSEMGRYDPRRSSLSVGTTRQWKAVDELFKRPWFERIWVIQEVSLANMIDIHIGTYVLTWSIFVQALQWCDEDNEHAKRSMMKPESLFNNACHLRNNWARRKFHGKAIGLEYLLQSFSHWKAEKTVDKVYALMGLSEAHDAPDLRIDYALSVPQVFSRVVRFFVNRDKRLSILGQCDNPPQCHDLPSWVPDWTPDRVYRQKISEQYRKRGSAQVIVRPDPVSGLPLILVPTNLALPPSGYGTWQQSREEFIPEEMNFCATLDTQAEALFPSDTSSPNFYCETGLNPKPESTMRLRGAEMDIIDTVSRPLFRLKEDVDDPSFMLSWEEFALLSPLGDGVDCPYRRTFEERLVIYWRTLITDRIARDRGNIRAPPVCGELFEKWRARMIQNADPADRYVPVTTETVDHNNITSQAQLMYNILSTMSLSQLRENPNIQLLDDQYRNLSISPAIMRPMKSPIDAEYLTWKRRFSDNSSQSKPTTSQHSPGQSFNIQASDSLTLNKDFTIQNFESSIRHWCFARKLALTVKGRLALVPEHTRPGDRLCLLFGGSVPYIVREKHDRMVVKGEFHDIEGRVGPPGETYDVHQPLHQFVGEAYVHGIMDGEGMQGLKQDGEGKLGQEYWFE